MTNKAKRIGLVILCRLWSKRLPQKALLSLNGVSCIKRCQLNCLKSTTPSCYILATSTNEDDAELRNHLVGNFQFVVGSEENIVERLLHCAECFSLDEIIRVTGDSPLISPDLIDLLVNSHISTNAEYSFWKGGSLGTVCDVISVSAIKRLSEWVDISKNTEYLSLFFRNNPSIFKINNPECPSVFASDYRLNLDYPEDKLLLDNVLSAVESHGFSKLENILGYLHSYPSVAAINKHINPVYTSGALSATLLSQTTIRHIKIHVDAPIDFIDLDWRGFEFAPDGTVEVLITNPGSDHLYDHQELSKYPALRVVATPSTGVTHIDTKHCDERGLKVLNLFYDRDGLNNIYASSEFTWLHILNAFKHFQLSVDYVRQGHWRDKEGELRGHELAGKSIGIIGLGRIGANVAKYATSFGMRVLYYDPDKNNQEYTRTHNLYDIAQCDVVSINPYLNETSKCMIDKRFLSKCKQNCIIVNTSRGEVVDEDAVCDAVSNGTVYYSTDVVCNEQYIERFHTSRLFSLFKDNKVVITPHIAGATVESQQKAMTSMLSIICRYFKDITKTQIEHA